VIIIGDSDDDDNDGGGGANRLAAAAAAAAASHDDHAQPRCAAPLPPLHPAALDRSVEAGPAALLRSLVARAAYGGMPGDVRMLRAAARVWRTRLVARGNDWAVALAAVNGLAPAATRAAGSGSSSSSSDADGGTSGGSVSADCCCYVPRDARPGGGAPVSCELARVPRLRPVDVPLAAIDFHCSGVLDALVSAQPAATAAFAAAAVAGTGRPPPSSDELRQLLQEAMWRYRSATNVRPRCEPAAVLALAAGPAGRRAPASRPLPPPDPADAVEQAWLRLCAPLVDAWCRTLLESRVG